jgi:hypothetical protein
LSSFSLICGTAARGFVAIHRDAHDLGAGAIERGHLAHGAVNIGSVGVGHRLHDDRRASADLHLADVDRNGLATLERRCGLGHRKLHETRR